MGAVAKGMFGEGQLAEVVAEAPGTPAGVAPMKLTPGGAVVKVSPQRIDELLDPNVNGGTPFGLCARLRK